MEIAVTTMKLLCEVMAVRLLDGTDMKIGAVLTMVGPTSWAGWPAVTGTHSRAEFTDSAAES